MDQLNYLIVFEYRGLPVHGVGPVATVSQVDGVLPQRLHDPHDWVGCSVLGTWRLTAVDVGQRLAFYELELD